MLDRIALFTLISIASAQPPPTSKSMPEPALPYLDWNACPFEACAYHQWIAREPVILFDTWQENRHKVTEIPVGEKVTGVTGVVITFKPGTIRVDRDLADQGLHRGDVILTYSYRGEGYSAVWFKDRFYSEFDISFAKWPDGTGCGGDHCAATYVDLGQKVWWAQVKLKTGQTAWVKMDGFPFDQ